MIEEIRATGAAIRLIGDGDVAGVIHTTSPDETGIDIYLGIGGAPEGVLAAAALRCIGGQMQGRLVINSDEQRERAIRMGVKDPNRKFDMTEMARGDVLFAATGVTDGNLLSGVRFGRQSIVTAHGGHALVVRHRALDQGRAPGPREVRRRDVTGPDLHLSAVRGEYDQPKRAQRSACDSFREGACPMLQIRIGEQSPSRAFLGVETSLTGRHWRSRLDAAGAGHALAIAQRHGIADIVARVLAGRGIRPTTHRPFSIRP